MQLNGEIPAGQQGSLLMAVIRYALPNEDNQLRKLCLLYLEIVDKTGRDGKMLPEMILVCNLLRNELIHPNEYSRGCALRLCCKLNEAELLEPLVPAIRQNLEHRHAYVRRNALLAVGSLYRRFPHLIPDISELIMQYLENEHDQSCRRNAFLVLIQADQRHAATYLLQHAEQLPSWNEVMQMAALELIRRTSAHDPNEKAAFVKLIFALLQSPNAAVAFEAAQTLVRLSAAPTAIRAAASTYCQLLLTQSDNNVKLILIDRITELRHQFAQIVQEHLMELLRALSSPDLHVRQRVLDLAMGMVGPRNVEEVVAALRKELNRLAESTSREESESEPLLTYRQMLIRAIHQSVIHYPEIAARMLGSLTDFLGDAAGLAGPEVIAFLRELGELYPQLCEVIMRRLLDALPMICSGRVFRGALWTLSEFCSSPKELVDAFAAISQQIGVLPLTLASDSNSTSAYELDNESGAQVPPFSANEHWQAVSDHDGDDHFGPESAAQPAKLLESSAARNPKRSSRPRVLPDGTYATESAYTMMVSERTAHRTAELDGQPGWLEGSAPTLRRLLLQGDNFLGVSVVSTLTKLALRLNQAHAAGDNVQSTPSVCRRATAYALLLSASLLRVGRFRTEPATRLDADAAERIASCIQVLLQAMESRLDPVVLHLWLESSHLAFCEMLRKHRATEAALASARAMDDQLPPDTLIDFRLLHARRNSTLPMKPFERSSTLKEGSNAATIDSSMDDAELAARGDSTERSPLRDFNLRHLHALSGLGDPVYVEAQITMHQYDIMLDIWMLNQTEQTLQNVCVELFTLGDLRLCERPSPLVLAPQQSRHIRVALKVSSTDTGVIFGNLVFDRVRSSVGSGSENGNGWVIALHEIRLDVMEYLRPGDIGETAFRTMWEEFEWENKVVIRSKLGSLSHLLELVAETLHMRCQSPRNIEQQSGFLAANLYATSVFGEHVLANISAECLPDGTIQGAVRIRSKTQGLALSLGDRLGQTAALTDSVS
ncbi:Coatomer subunit beta [Cyanidiococcus yangmingshanensis]|uniref:Coatomer subunit beta n=1 Tax=Cyanidiococcus yangmingshanensis TaxID=2690220 RepID=A0A7J7ICT1_9RHOD|nr:Coatomer subunit beta [Cyanidiococcus yangmingshanensis]